MVGALLRLAPCLLVIAAVAADVRHSGECPRINPNTTVEDFQPEQFAGEWHVTDSFDPAGACRNLSYAPCGAGCLLRVDERQQLDLLTALGVPATYRRLGQLRPTAGNNSAHMRASFTDATAQYDYVVLATDYDSFALVYTCRDVGVASFTLYHRRNVLLLSREQNGTATPEQMDQVSEILTANGLEDEFAPAVRKQCVPSSTAYLFDTVQLTDGASRFASVLSDRLSSFVAGALAAVGLRQ